VAFYNSVVNAKLYIGTSTAVPLPAYGSDTFTEVPLLSSITPPPNEQAVSFFSILNDANKRSLAGKLGDRLCEGSLVIDWTQSVHTSMYSDSVTAGGVKRNWRIVYPDTGNRQLDFAATLNKWTEEPFDAGEDAKEHRASFSLAVDGAITVTP